MKYNSNNKKKKRITSIISMLLIAILLITSNTITTFADSFFSFNGDGGAGGKVGSGFGFSSRNTGWLAYMVDDAGNLAPGCSTVLLYSPGANLSGNDSIMTSRCGQRPSTVKGSYVSGAWNCLPWTGSNQSWTSNTSKIKEWFTSKNTSGGTNAYQFIKDMGWGGEGTPLYEGFKADEYDIVLELVARAQFGRKVSDKPQTSVTIDKGSIRMTVEQQKTAIERLIGEAKTAAVNAGYGPASDSKDNLNTLKTKLNAISSAVAQINRNTQAIGCTIDYDSRLGDYLRDVASGKREQEEAKHLMSDASSSLGVAINKMLDAINDFDPSKSNDNSQGGYEPVPDECFVGTLLNLSSAGTEAYRRYCTSLLLERMPVSEYLTHDDDSFRAGATSRLSTWMTDTKQGNGMLIIHCKDPGQTTCDEPLAPSQHPAPKESTGTFTILKDYRTKKGEEIIEYTASSLVRDSVDGNITIENEKGWKVVEWATSSSTTPTNGRNWNPGGKIQSGKTPRTVQLKKSNNEKGLYVLLEKTEDEEIEELEYDRGDAEASFFMLKISRCA